MSLSAKNDTIALNYKLFIIFFSVILNYVLVHLVLASNLDSNNNFSNLKLVGTIIGKNTLAIIRIKDNTDGIYQLNQKIAGYTITAITKTTITLTKQNKPHTLALIAVKNRLFYGNKPLPKNTTAPKVYQYRINRNTFNSLAANTQSWLNNVHMEMQIEKGYFTGYKIVQVQENSPADLLGLSEGDVIRGINGILIKNSPDNFIKKISTLENATVFTLNMRHKQSDFKLQFIIEDK